MLNKSRQLRRIKRMIISLIGQAIIPAKECSTSAIFFVIVSTLRQTPRLNNARSVSHSLSPYPTYRLPDSIACHLLIGAENSQHKSICEIHSQKVPPDPSPVDVSKYMWLNYFSVFFPFYGKGMLFYCQRVRDIDSAMWPFI